MRLFSIAVLSCMLVFGISAAYGHAPKEVNLKFELDEKLLEVRVQHQVNDAAKHFVSKVTVELNGKRIVEQMLAAQENMKDQVLVYRITDARVGDNITVTADCNISGKKKASLEIKPPPKETKKDGE